MNISGVGSASPLDSLAGVSANAKRTPSSIPPAAGAPAASAKISGPGQLLGKLQQLAEQDPAKFKQATADIAAELRASAQSSSGPGADFANKLADRFEAASQSGDMSSLEPQQGAGGAQGHHHHHHGGGGGGGGIASVMSNALDEVNQALAGSLQGASTSSDASTSSEPT